MLGSPVLDEQGKVFGVVHGGPKADVSFRGSSVNNGIEVDSQFTNKFGIITNLVCKELFVSNYDFSIDHALCARSTERASFDQVAYGKIQEQTNAFVKNNELLYPNIFGYQMVNTSELNQVIPVCVKKLETWTEAQRKKYLIHEGGGLQKMFVELGLYSFGVELELDYYGNVEAKISSSNDKQKYYFYSRPQFFCGIPT